MMNSIFRLWQGSKSPQSPNMEDVIDENELAIGTKRIRDELLEEEDRDLEKKPRHGLEDIVGEDVTTTTSTTTITTSNPHDDEAIQDVEKVIVEDDKQEESSTDENEDSYRLHNDITNTSELNPTNEDTQQEDDGDQHQKQTILEDVITATLTNTSDVELSQHNDECEKEHDESTTITTFENDFSCFRKSSSLLEASSQQEESIHHDKEEIPNFPQENGQESIFKDSGTNGFETQQQSIAMDNVSPPSESCDNITDPFITASTANANSNNDMVSVDFMPTNDINESIFNRDKDDGHLKPVADSPDVNTEDKNDDEDGEKQKPISFMVPLASESIVPTSTLVNSDHQLDSSTSSLKTNVLNHNAKMDSTQESEEKCDSMDDEMDGIITDEITFSTPAYIESERASLPTDANIRVTVESMEVEHYEDAVEEKLNETTVDVTTATTINNTIMSSLPNTNNRVSINDMEIENNDDVVDNECLEATGTTALETSSVVFPQNDFQDSEKDHSMEVFPEKTAEVASEAVLKPTKSSLTTSPLPNKKRSIHDCEGDNEQTNHSSKKKDVEKSQQSIALASPNESVLSPSNTHLSYDCVGNVNNLMYGRESLTLETRVLKNRRAQGQSSTPVSQLASRNLELQPREKFMQIPSKKMIIESNQASRLMGSQAQRTPWNDPQAALESPIGNPVARSMDLPDDIFNSQQDNSAQRLRQQQHFNDPVAAKESATINLPTEPVTNANPTSINKNSISTQTPQEELASNQTQEDLQTTAENLDIPFPFREIEKDVPASQVSHSWLRCSILLLFLWITSSAILSGLWLHEVINYKLQVQELWQEQQQYSHSQMTEQDLSQELSYPTNSWTNDNPPTQSLLLEANKKLEGCRMEFQRVLEQLEERKVSTPEK